MGEINPLAVLIFGGLAFFPLVALFDRQIEIGA